MNHGGFVWPSGFKSAVCLSWDLDGESAHYVRNPEMAGNQLSELTQRSYGPEVGVWKVLDMLERNGIKGTFYIPGYTARLHPEPVKRIVEAGHSVGLHGYMHETMESLSETQENELMDRSIAALEETTGRRPGIFRSPSFELNRRTPDILIKHGVDGDSSLMGDDYPYIISTASGKLVELPVQWIMDDAEFWGHTRANRSKPIADPDTALKIWTRELDGIHEHGGCFVLTMHPFISGRWVYIDVIEKLIKHIKSLDGVWVASTEEVTEYCLENAERDFIRKRELPSPVPLGF